VPPPPLHHRNEDNEMKMDAAQKEEQRYAKNRTAQDFAGNHYEL
jgi:hypothetical protein